MYLFICRFPVTIVCIYTFFWVRRLINSLYQPLSSYTILLYNYNYYIMYTRLTNIKRVCQLYTHNITLHSPTRVICAVAALSSSHHELLTFFCFFFYADFFLSLLLFSLYTRVFGIHWRFIQILSLLITCVCIYRYSVTVHRRIS